MVAVGAHGRSNPARRSWPEEKSGPSAARMITLTALSGRGGGQRAVELVEQFGMLRVACLRPCQHHPGHPGRRILATDELFGHHFHLRFTCRRYCGRYFSLSLRLNSFPLSWRGNLSLNSTTLGAV